MEDSGCPGFFEHRRHTSMHSVLGLDPLGPLLVAWGRSQPVGPVPSLSPHPNDPSSPPPPAGLQCHP